MATSSPTCWARVARASVRTPTRAAWRRPTSSGSRRSGRAKGDIRARWRTSSLQGVADPGHGPLVEEHALEGVAALGQDGGQALGGEAGVQGLGAEAGQGRDLLHVVDQPDRCPAPGAALGHGQDPAVVEPDGEHGDLARGRLGPQDQAPPSDRCMTSRSPELQPDVLGPAGRPRSRPGRPDCRSGSKVLRRPPRPPGPRPPRPGQPGRQVLGQDVQLGELGHLSRPAAATAPGRSRRRRCR